MKLVSFICVIQVRRFYLKELLDDNDDTDTNISWFLHFYRMVLETLVLEGKKDDYNRDRVYSLGRSW